MELVKDYFDGWIADLSGRVHLGYGKWPDLSNRNGWQAFFDALRSASAGRDMAYAVIERLSLSPPENVADAVTAVQASIRELQRSNTVVGDREQALAASMSWSRDRTTGEPCPCEDCGGDGKTYYVRTDRQPFDVKTSGGLRRRVMELVMTCTCPYGRWITVQPKCPFPDSQKYGQRVMTRFAWETRDVVDPDEYDGGSDARSMINRTFSRAS